MGTPILGNLRRVYQHEFKGACKCSLQALLGQWSLGWPGSKFNSQNWIIVYSSHFENDHCCKMSQDVRRWKLGFLKLIENADHENAV